MGSFIGLFSGEEAIAHIQPVGIISAGNIVKILIAAAEVEGAIVDFQHFQVILHPEHDVVVVGDAVDHSNVRPAAAARPAQAEADLVAVGDHSFHQAIDFLLDVEGCPVVDVSRHEAVGGDVAQGDLGPVGGADGIFVDLGIDGVFARDFSGVPVGGIGRQRAGPEGAVLDQYIIPQRVVAVGVGLETVAGGIINVAAANGQVLLPGGHDAVGVDLIGERPSEHVMDFAVLDQHIIGLVHVDPVFGAVADFAVAQDGVVAPGADLHHIAAVELAVKDQAVDGDVAVIDAQRATAGGDQRAVGRVIGLDHDPLPRLTAALGVDILAIGAGQHHDHIAGLSGVQRIGKIIERVAQRSVAIAAAVVYIISGGEAQDR